MDYNVEKIKIPNLDTKININLVCRLCLRETTKMKRIPFDKLHFTNIAIQYEFLTKLQVT